MTARACLCCLENAREYHSSGECRAYQAQVTMNTDPEASTFQNRPAYRYIRAADHLPATEAVTADSLALVKLFNPTGGQTWYLAGYDATDTGRVGAGRSRHGRAGVWVHRHGGTR